MAREDFIAVGIRLFAIFLAFKIVETALTVFQLFTVHDSGAWAGFHLALCMAGLVGCAVLWVFPLSIARKLLPVMREPRSDVGPEASLALAIGLTLLGFWLLAQALPDAAYWLLLVHHFRADPYDAASWSIDQIARMTAIGVKILVGLALVLGSVGIQRLVERLRFGAPSSYGRPRKGEHE